MSSGHLLDDPLHQTEAQTSAYVRCWPVRSHDAWCLLSAAHLRPHLSVSEDFSSDGGIQVWVVLEPRVEIVLSEAALKKLSLSDKCLILPGK